MEVGRYQEGRWKRTFQRYFDRPEICQSCAHLQVPIHGEMTWQVAMASNKARRHGLRSRCARGPMPIDRTCTHPICPNMLTKPPVCIAMPHPALRC